jgi:1,4-alpha-glucan branching enzyme
MLSKDDLKLFHSGRLLDAYEQLGAHCAEVEGRPGARFATWAPGAHSVSVVGDFNDWDGRRNPMSLADADGVWELFVPGLGAGTGYKFELQNEATGQLVIKTDPYARAFPSQANTNAIVTAPTAYRWGDAEWMTKRRSSRWREAPINIYEVHLGSWRRDQQGSFLGYEELAREIAVRARELRFTHVELLPVFEHPLDESLGYQVTGYFAPTSRFGSPDQFRAFVDHCHGAGLGVILDWVPLHFPKDCWGLADFDGGPLYERDDPDMAEHPQWHTLIFNYGRPEVRNFLLSNALFWLREFHADGLRVDAVSSMLYLDDGRAERSFKRNPLGGRENLPAVKFLREMNASIAELVPDALTIAEESTSWPAVSQPAKRGGLGFSMKWNMGWVHDTLSYLSLPWSERPAHHRDLTFERLYAKKERFVLALSHDESAATKGSLFEQMHGDDAQKFAGLRLLFTYQSTYPGKKLIFMGDEFGQARAWGPTVAIDWDALSREGHAQVAAAVRDLGELYRRLPALHADDSDHTGFRWLDPDDAQHCVTAYQRCAGEAFALVVLNFSPAVYEEYVLGVPRDGAYQILFDSAAVVYGGAGTRLLRERSRPEPRMGLEHSISLRLPALTGVVIGLA